MITKQTWDKYEQALSSNQQDWKTREKTFQSLLKGLKDDHVMTFEFMQQNSKLFAIQLNDLRSGIVKLTSSCLIIFSQKQPLFYKTINYEKFIDQILRREEFVKSIGSANKVIASHAAQALLAFFQNDLVNFSTLEFFVQKYHTHKIAKIRERCAEIMSIFMKRIIQHQSSQKIKKDQIDLFKRIGKKFCDDANGPVRKFGKIIKVELIDFTQAIEQNGFDCQYSKSQPIDDTIQSKQKLSKKKMNTTKIKKQYSIPQQPKQTQMEIEDDYSIISKSKQERQIINKQIQKSNTHMSKINSKSKKRKKLSIKEILIDEDMSLLEKVNFLRNYDFDQYCRNVNFTELRTLLDIYENLDDQELLSWVDKIISQIEIQSYFLQLLMFLETNGRNYDKLPSTIWNNIFSQNLILFVQYFQTQNSFESLQLLNKRFDVDEFEILARNDFNLIQDLINIIQVNVCNNSNTQSFLALNFEFLELLFQSYEIMQKYKRYKFDINFLEKMENFKPNLYKFFSVHRREQQNKQQNKNKYKSKEILQKSSKKAQKQKKEIQQNNNHYQQNQPYGMEIEEENNQQKVITEEEENIQLVKMLVDANLQTRKSVLQQIQQHLDELQINSDLDINEKQKLFKKTIAILTCLSETEQIDKQLLVQCFEIMDILQNFLVDPVQDLNTLIYTSLRFFENKYYSRDISSERLLQTSLRKQYLTFFISELNILEDFEKIVKVLKSFISLLKVGKFSDYQQQFLNEFLQIQDSIITVMQKLFIHQQVSVRKNVVHFFVQAYHFIPAEDFEELLYPFSQEQKKLIEIYIKKSKSQQLIQQYLNFIFKDNLNCEDISNKNKVKKIMQEFQINYDLSLEEVLVNIRKFPTPKSLNNCIKQIRKKKVKKNFDKSFLIPSKFKRDRISSLEVMSFMFFQSNKQWFIQSIKEARYKKQLWLKQKKLLQKNNSVKIA